MFGRPARADSPQICSPQMKSPIPMAMYCQNNKRIEIEMMLLRFVFSSSFWAYANLCLDTQLAGCVLKFDDRVLSQNYISSAFYQ